MDDVLRRLIAFAEREENIRAVLLAGSRANPRGVVDEWSDYDVSLVTRSNEPYLQPSWFAEFAPQFGDIAIAQTPDDRTLFDDAHDPLEHYAYLTQYADGLRLDLSFATLAYVRTITLESETVVLLDKDGQFPQVEPSDRDHWVKLPSASAYRACCNEFWWTAPYVAKAVARGQTIAAIELLGSVVRPQFVRMLTWWAASHGGPATNVGKYGTDLGRHVPADFYGALLASYPRADLDDIRSALTALVGAFPAAARGVADALGFVYDAREGERASEFLASRFGIRQP